MYNEKSSKIVQNEEHWFGRFGWGLVTQRVDFCTGVYTREADV